jgi:hypothetical protein
MIYLIRRDIPGVKPGTTEPIFTLADLEPGKIKFLADANDGSVWWTDSRFISDPLLKDAGLVEWPPTIDWNEIPEKI